MKVDAAEAARLAEDAEHFEREVERVQRIRERFEGEYGDYLPPDSIPYRALMLEHRLRDFIAALRAPAAGRATPTD